MRYLTNLKIEATKVLVAIVAVREGRPGKFSSVKCHRIRAQI